MTHDISCFEQRLDRMQAKHPEIPRQAVILMRLTYHLTRVLHDRLDGYFAEHGLSHSAWAVLMMVYSSPEQSLSPSEVSSAVVQSRTHMTRIADELVAAGWIERVRDLADRRRISLRLTSEGRQRIERLLPLTWAEYERAIAGFSPEQLTSLEDLLRTWIDLLALPSSADARAATNPEVEAT